MTLSTYFSLKNIFFKLLCCLIEDLHQNSVNYICLLSACWFSTESHIFDSITINISIAMPCMWIQLLHIYFSQVFFCCFHFNKKFHLNLEGKNCLNLPTKRQTHTRWIDVYAPAFILYTFSWNHIIKHGSM